MNTGRVLPSPQQVWDTSSNKVTQIAKSGCLARAGINLVETKVTSKEKIPRISAVRMTMRLRKTTQTLTWTSNVSITVVKTMSPARSIQRTYLSRNEGRSGASIGSQHLKRERADAAMLILGMAEEGHLLLRIPLLRPSSKLKSGSVPIDQRLRLDNTGPISFRAGTSVRYSACGVDRLSAICLRLCIVNEGKRTPTQYFLSFVLASCCFCRICDTVIGLYHDSINFNHGPSTFNGGILNIQSHPSGYEAASAKRISVVSVNQSPIFCHQFADSEPIPGGGQIVTVAVLSRLGQLSTAFNCWNMSDFSRRT